MPLWRVADGTEIRCLLAMDHNYSSEGYSVYCVAFAPDVQTLAVGGDDGAMRMWRVAGPSSFRRLWGKRLVKYVSCVAFSPDGRILAVGVLNDAVRLHRVDDGSLIRALPGPVHFAACVAFSPDGRTLAVGGQETGSDDTLIRL